MPCTPETVYQIIGYVLVKSHILSCYCFDLLLKEGWSEATSSLPHAIPRACGEGEVGELVVLVVADVGVKAVGVKLLRVWEPLLVALYKGD